jgi:hypothetical protein
VGCQFCPGRPFRDRRFDRCIIHRLPSTQPIYSSLQHRQVFGHRLSHLSKLIRNFNPSITILGIAPPAIKSQSGSLF